MKRASFCTLLLLVTTATVQAQKSIGDEELDPVTGTRVQVRSVFDPLPPSGYAPMRVTAVNGTRYNVNWGFRFHSQIHNYPQNNKVSSSFLLPMPAHSTQSALFLVPVAASYGASGYNSENHTFNLNIENTGFNTRVHYDHDRRVSGFPSIAISSMLAEYSIAGLNKEVESKMRSTGSFYGGSADLFGSQFEPTDLPDSWLGFSGFDFVMLSNTDWQRLKPGVRRAVLDWVRLGGRLHVYVSSGVSTASLGLPGGENAGQDLLSLGKITVLSWDGKKLGATETVSRYWKEPKRIEDLVENHATTGNWPLVSLLGSRSFASWQVIVFLIVFGLCVGPINLFVLAPAGKRHKLFVTTPLLSIGASVVMIVLILFQDGTGGIGQRFVAIDLEPAEATAYVTQEQISRTGVLLGAAFEVKQPALIEPVSLPTSPWAKLKSGRQGQGVDLTQDGRERRGNFFQSRAEQGQMLRAAVSTRARLELKAGVPASEAPVVISALGFPVEELHYIDDAGTWWTLKGTLNTGQSGVLVHADESAARLWRGKLIEPAEKNLRDRINNTLLDRRSFFIAKAAETPDFTIETLGSIRWEDQIVVFGPVAKP